MMKQRLSRGALVLGVVCVLGLVGCSPSTPPSPSPEPTKTESTKKTSESDEVGPPKTAEDAIDGAREGFDDFIDTVNATLSDPAKSGELNKVATGSALEDMVNVAKQIDEKGLSYSGEFEFSFESGAAGELQIGDQVTEFGAVTLKGCYDQTGVDVKRADGSPSPMGEVRRYVIRPKLVFNAEQGRWLVRTHDLEPQLVVEC